MDRTGQFFEGPLAHPIQSLIGASIEEPFADAVIESLATQFKLPITPTPRRVHILQRGVYKICLNYSGKPFEVPPGKTARFVVGSHTVEPADVAVWEETE